MELNIVTKDNLTLTGYSITNSSYNTSDEEYFSYDYYDSVNDLPFGEVIPVTLVYSATFIVGVLGNSLVIFSIAHYRRLQTVTNIFLTSLASADLLLVVLCVPIQLAKWFAFTWQFGEALCKIVHYLQNMSVICSVLTLTAMSIERYYAIIHPMKAKFVCTVSRAKRVIIAVWMLSITLSTPILLGQVHKEVGEERKAFWCVKEWADPVYSQLYEVSMLMLIFILPLAIITYAYINICIELWIMTSKRASMRAGNMRHSADQVEMSYVNDGKCVQGAIRLRRLRKPTSDDDRTRKQVIKMLVIVIFLFAICWGPLLIDNVLQAFGIVEDLNYGTVKHARQAFAVMAYANSCVNPVVYAFMSKNFRDSFRHAIFACCPRRARFLGARPMRQVSFQTHSTSVTTTRVPSCRHEWDLEDAAEDEVNSDCPLDNKLSDQLESAM